MGIWMGTKQGGLVRGISGLTRRSPSQQSPQVQRAATRGQML